MDGQVLTVSGWEPPILLRRVPLGAVHLSGVLSPRNRRLFQTSEGTVARPPVRTCMAVFYGGEQREIALSEPDARPLAEENRKLRLQLAQLSKGQDKPLAWPEGPPKFSLDAEDDSLDHALGDSEEDAGEDPIGS